MIEGIVAGLGVLVLLPAVVSGTAMWHRVTFHPTAFPEALEPEKAERWMALADTVKHAGLLKTSRIIYWCVSAEWVLTVYCLVRFVRWAWQAPMPFIGS